ncbi:MAG: ribonuclease P protein component [Burkholderiaceae bacterium]|nr:MAG: ribonuclease P protein component [Burkholderiaceae bacterium]TBR77793.1 MAG: ribonuclease P protein component [Burkholderiaceae bacterium]
MQRLKTRAQFQAAMAGGIVSRTAHFILHRCALESSMPASETPIPVAAQRPAPAAPSAHQVWIGALVPRRWARRAVTRNTIRRQIYAVGADMEPGLTPAAHVVRLRAGFDRAQFVSATSAQLKRAVRSELQQLFRQAPASAEVQRATS